MLPKDINTIEMGDSPCGHGHLISSTVPGIGPFRLAEDGWSVLGWSTDGARRWKIVWQSMSKMRVMHGAFPGLNPGLIN